MIESELSRKEKQRKAEEQEFLLAKEKQEQVSLTEADYRLEADATTAMLSHLEMQIEDGERKCSAIRYHAGTDADPKSRSNRKAPSDRQRRCQMAGDASGISNCLRNGVGRD